MEKQAHKRTLAYIIDSDFKIVFSNSELKYIVPEAKHDQNCYEIFGNEHGQCKKCPLRSENDGSSILFDHLRNEWISVASAPIDIPGLGTCHVVINDAMEDSSNSFLYNAAGKSDYAELLELDYGRDFFRVAYHGERKHDQSPLSGSITAMVHALAERVIHPDDRARFFDFWLLDRIGADELPVQLFTARHGEFRKLRSDGGYDWVQQVMLPIRQSSQTEIFVNNFFNTIDMAACAQLPMAQAAKDNIADKDEFFRRAAAMIAQADADAKWSLIAIDVERLKLFNEWYGRKAGDALLTGITQCLRRFQDSGPQMIAGHFYDDDFAFLMPGQEETVIQLCKAVSARIKQSSDKMNILPAFGIYTVKGCDETVFSMYDRAKLACNSLRGNFSQRIKHFDTQMLEKLQAEYLLLSDVQKAFQNHEFTFHLQPKCNTETGKIAGAEALARWFKPGQGMVSPGIFVPFLEKSGLISELDTYIWEEVCKWQRSMLDRGADTKPVSVNVSRIDIYAVDVCAYFQNLIQKYDLDPSLIEIEITESAYATDADTITQVVRGLRSAGFCVLMDDFGSAYSSLNMLRDIEVDVLKLDMRFLDSNGGNDPRGLNIVETVCHMAHLLGLKIVAEGVETQAQREMLLKAGCAQCQGYYFYRPQSIADFEALLADPEKLDNLRLHTQSDALFHLKDLLLQNAFSLNMLDNIIGAMAFYDVHGEEISILRFNEQYAALLGLDISSMEMHLHFGQQLYSEDTAKVYDMFNLARLNPSTGSNTDLHRCKPDGTDMWLNVRMFFLYSRDGHDIFYSTVRDVTRIHRSNQELQFLNNDMPGGYYRHADDKACTFTHISQRFLDIFGYTRQEIKELFDDKLINMVHPGDRVAVYNGVATLEQNGGNYTQPCRMRSKNGYIFVLDQSRLVEYDTQKVFQGIILCDFDHYVWFNENNCAEDGSAIANLMPCGFFQAEVDDRHRFSYVSNSMLQMLGYSRDEFHKKFKDNTENLVYVQDLSRLKAEILKQLNGGTFVSTEYRVETADGTLKWVYSRAQISTDLNGKRWFNCCIIDHDYLKEKYEVQRWQYLKYKSLSTIPGAMVFDYDPKNDCLSVEMTDKDGSPYSVVADHYTRDIEQWGLVAQEHTANQKNLLQQASARPGNGISEFRGRIPGQPSLRWYRFRYSSLADEAGHVYRVIGHGFDVNSEKLTISSLTRRASKDSLTGLLNYESAKERACEELRSSMGGMLFLLDIDDFKGINDTMGHLVGDKLLKMFAALIHSAFRKDGICCRFGGDEFLVFVPGLTDRKQAEALITTLLKSTARLQYAEGHWLRCSIGIAERGDHDELLFDTLFQQADTALYHSKRSGKARYTFYTDKLNGILSTGDTTF